MNQQKTTTEQIHHTSRIAEQQRRDAEKIAPILISLTALGLGTAASFLFFPRETSQVLARVALPLMHHSKDYATYLPFFTSWFGAKNVKKEINKREAYSLWGIAVATTNFLGAAFSLAALLFQEGVTLPIPTDKLIAPIPTDSLLPPIFSDKLFCHTLTLTLSGIFFTLSEFINLIKQYKEDTKEYNDCKNKVESKPTKTHQLKDGTQVSLQTMKDLWGRRRTINFCMNTLKTLSCVTFILPPLLALSAANSSLMVGAGLAAWAVFFTMQTLLLNYEGRNYTTNIVDVPNTPTKRQKEKKVDNLAGNPGSN